MKREKSGKVRELPSAPEAELAVLSAVACDPDRAAPLVLERLSAEHFHDPRARQVFAVMKRLSAQGLGLDPVTLGEEMASTGEMDRAGGFTYLGDLLDAVPDGRSVQHHIEIIKDRALRRRLFQSAREIAGAALAQDVTTAADAVAQAEQTIYRLSREAGGEGLVKASEVLFSALALIEGGGLPGVESEVAALNDLTGGYKPGHLILVAGSTSMGKSALVLQEAAHAAVVLDKHVAVFSVEMTRDENLVRMIANRARLNLFSLLQGQSMTTAEEAKLREVATELHTANLHLDDGAIRVSEIRSRALRLKAESGLDLIVVDQLHDLEGEGETRRAQIESIALDLKRLAMELQVPVIAAAHLSRAGRERSDKRPIMSDLRESGRLEQLANEVILLYRPEYFFGPMHDGQDIRGRAEAIVAKQRNGPTGTVNMQYLAYCCRFVSA